MMSAESASITQRCDRHIQTYYHCYPHFLAQGQLARVVVRKSCQTAISVEFGSNDADIYTLLQFTPFRSISHNCLRQIDLPRKAHLHWNLVDSENSSASISVDKHAVTSGPGRKSNPSVISLSKLAQELDPPGPKRSAFNNRKLVTAKSVESNVTRRKVMTSQSVQTVLRVTPHVLDSDEVAIVYTDDSIQTSVTCIPDESTSTVVSRLQANLSHRGIDASVGVGVPSGHRELPLPSAKVDASVSSPLSEEPEEEIRVIKPIDEGASCHEIINGNFVEPFAAAAASTALDRGVEIDGNRSRRRNSCDQLCRRCVKDDGDSSQILCGGIEKSKSDSHACSKRAGAATCTNRAGSDTSSKVSVVGERGQKFSEMEFQVFPSSVPFELRMIQVTSEIISSIQANVMNVLRVCDDESVSDVIRDNLSLARRRPTSRVMVLRLETVLVSSYPSDSARDRRTPSGETTVMTCHHETAITEATQPPTCLRRFATWGGLSPRPASCQHSTTNLRSLMTAVPLSNAARHLIRSETFLSHLRNRVIRFSVIFGNKQPDPEKQFEELMTRDVPVFERVSSYRSSSSSSDLALRGTSSDEISLAERVAALICHPAPPLNSPAIPNFCVKFPSWGALPDEINRSISTLLNYFEAAVQTDLILGHKLFSDSLASIASADKRHRQVDAGFQSHFPSKRSNAVSILPNIAHCSSQVTGDLAEIYIDCGEPSSAIVAVSSPLVWLTASDYSNRHKFPARTSKDMATNLDARSSAGDNKVHVDDDSSVIVAIKSSTECPFPSRTFRVVDFTGDGTKPSATKSCGGLVTVTSAPPSCDAERVPRPRFRQSAPAVVASQHLTSLQMVLAPTPSNSTASQDLATRDVSGDEYKTDPIGFLLRVYEEEMKPLRKALAQLQEKIQNMNIPELDAIMRPVHSLYRPSDSLESSYDNLTSPPVGAAATAAPLLHDRFMSSPYSNDLSGASLRDCPFYSSYFGASPRWSRPMSAPPFPYGSPFFIPYRQLEYFAAPTYRYECPFRPSRTFASSDFSPLDGRYFDRPLRLNYDNDECTDRYWDGGASVPLTSASGRRKKTHYPKCDKLSDKPQNRTDTWRQSSNLASYFQHDRDVFSSLNLQPGQAFRTNPEDILPFLKNRSPNFCSVGTCTSHIG